MRVATAAARGPVATPDRGAPTGSDQPGLLTGPGQNFGAGQAGSQPYDGGAPQVAHPRRNGLQWDATGVLIHAQDGRNGPIEHADPLVPLSLAHVSNPGDDLGFSHFTVTSCTHSVVQTYLHG